MKNLSLYLILALLSVASIAQQKDSAFIAYQSGLTEKQAGRHKVAYDHLRKAVSINPEHTDAQRELGLEAMELRQFEISKQAFLKVLDKEPNDPQAIENLGTLNFWTRRWDEAIKFGLKMQELKIGSRVNYLLGKSYYEKENFGQAFRYLDAAYKEEPTNAEIPFMFARSFVEMSNYKQAVKYYLEAIALDSTKINWIYETAMAYSSIPDDKTAIKYFELAMARGYKVDNDFIENLSNSYILAGMPDKGIDMLLKLLELRPADMELLNSIADTYYRLGKYDDAVTYWDKMLFYDKENARPLYMIGMCYQKKGEIKKGQAICDKAIEMDPSLKMLRQEKKMPGL
jgi:tetratricopeptide (TPR) repeat protein